MKLTSLAITSLLISLIACNKKYVTPNCIETKISQFKNITCQHKASVKEYRFEEKEVYVFEMGNCGADLTADVFDSDCNLLGYLGGIQGNTKINGIEFSTAVYIRTIWSN